MTQTNHLGEKSFNLASSTKPMALGGVIGLAVAAFFILSTKYPQAEWGKLWMVRPLIVLTLAGAMGGLFYSIMGMFRNQNQVKTISINVLCLLVFIIGLWMGIVLGFSGTIWN